MMNLKFFYAPLLFALLPLLLMGQQRSYSDVVQTRMGGMDAIVNQEGQVTGYYFFYQNGKAKRGTAEYRLKLLDQNLEEIGTKAFTGSSNLALTDVVYNGKAIAMRLLDPKEEEVSIKVFDGSGKMLNGRKFEASAYDLLMQQQGVAQPLLYSAGMEGFVHYSVQPRKGIRSQTDYQFQYIANTRDNRGWQAKSASSSEEYEAANFLGATEDRIYSVKVSRKGLMNRDWTYSVLAHDVASGDLVYTRALDSKPYGFLPYELLPVEGGIRLFGEFFGPEDKTLSDRPLGLGMLTLDENGEVTNQQYLRWEKEIGQIVPVNLRGKIEDVGFLFLHNFTQLEDGTTIAIMESYRKAVSALGVASQFTGGNAAAMKVVTEDLYVFTFSPDFELTALEIIEKSKTSVELPRGGSFLNAQILGLLTDAFGGFDYAHRQIDGDVVTIGYQDFVREKGEPRRNIYGSLTLLDGEWTTDEINLDDSDADHTRVINAKPGYILLVDYFRKEKRLNFHLEKINN